MLVRHQNSTILRELNARSHTVRIFFSLCWKIFVRFNLDEAGDDLGVTCSHQHVEEAHDVGFGRENRVFNRAQDRAGGAWWIRYFEF